MDKNDVQIGMKVVPSTKSTGCPLHLSEQYKAMKDIKQPFMYVAHQHANDKRLGSDRFMLTYDKGHIYLGGDYFRSPDFEPFIEE